MNTSQYSKVYDDIKDRSVRARTQHLIQNDVHSDKPAHRHSQSSRKCLIRRIFTPTFHVVRLKNPSGDSSVRLFFSISTCIIIVNFSLCSDQRRRLGVKISYCQQIKKITEALRLLAWCLSENGRRASTWHPRAAIANQKLAFYSESIQCCR